MKNKKIILAKLFYFSGSIQFAQRLVSNRLIVFNYHRIRPDAFRFDSLFDDDVFGPTQNELKKQLIWLQHHTTILSESDLIDIVATGRRRCCISTLVTFDDGYRDNFTLAYPILKELKIPAIFFIATDQINSRKLGWWDITAYCIKHSKKKEITYHGRTFDLSGQCSQSIRHFHKILQMMDARQQKRVLNELFDTCGVQYPDLDEQSAQLMDWDQIRSMSGNGIAIGSHTHTHPILSRMSETEQRYEMMESGAIIESQTGRRPRSIAYPVGRHIHISAKTPAIASGAGYCAGFSFNTGINSFRELDPFNIKRIDGSDNIYTMTSSTILPNLFTWRE